MSALSLERLWRRYRRIHNANVREELVGACQPLVNHVVNRFKLKFPTTNSADDLVSYGFDGVLRAIDSFSPESGTTFESWTRQCVEWAIHDGMRLESWIPRNVWIYEREVDRVESALHNKLHRSPTRQEMATALGWTIEKYEGHLIDIQQSSLLSLDEPFRITDMGIGSLLDVVGYSDSPDPETLFEARQPDSRLPNALSQLPTRERFVIDCYYKHELTQSEIGKALGITGSRVSQLLSAALEQLRTTLTSPQRA